MIKFTIVNGSLQISRGTTNVLYMPNLYIGLDSLSLYEAEPRVILFNITQSPSFVVFEGLLSECTDDVGTPFTLNSFLTFASNYFGTSSSTIIAGDVNAFITNDVNNPVPITGTGVGGAISVTGALTDAQIRATPLPISPRANTLGTGGTTPYKLISTASTNANSVKGSAGNLYSIVAIGQTSTIRYLKLYNKATAPSVGTDVPVMTIPVPANLQGAGVSIPFSMGVNFSLGISLAITSGSADNDTGVVGAGDVILNLTYA